MCAMRIMRISIIVLLMALTLALLSCGQKKEKAGFGKPVVTVSILPLKFFVDQIAGDLLEVNVMVPPGASPASYSPSKRQMTALEDSPIYFTISALGFERIWLDKTAASQPDLKMIDLGEGLKLERTEHQVIHQDHAHHHHNTDPHIWMSPRHAGVISLMIYQELAKMFPEYSEVFTNNQKILTDSIYAMHVRIEDKIAPLQQRSFIIFHPALTYYAADYGLKQISMEWEGKEPSPGHLKEIVETARKERVDKVLIQSQFDTEQAAILAKEINADIEQIDPLDENWFEQIWHITQVLCDEK